MPAAVPGAGEDAVAVDVEDVGVHPGRREAALRARRRSVQCVVQSRPSSRPAAPRTKAPLHTLMHPGAAGRRGPQRLEQLGGHVDVAAGSAGTAIRSASASRSEAVLAPPGRSPERVRTGPGVGGAQREVEGRQRRVVGAVDAEHLAEHAELEGEDLVQDGDGDVADHAAAVWQEVVRGCQSCHWWRDVTERRVTAMTTFLVLLAAPGPRRAGRRACRLFRHDRPAAAAGQPPGLGRRRRCRPARTRCATDADAGCPAVGSAS